MKILIVSGFLGAGKTTFIKRLARNVDQRFAYWKMNMEPQESTAHVLARTGKERRKMYGK